MHESIISKMQGKNIKLMKIGCASATFILNDETELMIESESDGNLIFRLKYYDVKNVCYTSTRF